jgi:3'5'-cyclic nucleotide phosphodiesterase
MIHDLDHYGVSNSQLIKEESPIARKYRNKSVAEQNSVDLAWDLLMDKDEYGDFQQCIFVNQSEFKRFRQVVCNLVMATDIFDSELQTLRKDRWEKAFHEKAAFDEDYENRKATIVIEHIMQASDVAHTMQHWHIYQKWNRRLFDELYTAYRSGRMAVDPSTFWYQGKYSHMIGRATGFSHFSLLFQESSSFSIHM